MGVLGDTKRLIMASGHTDSSVNIEFSFSGERTIVRVILLSRSTLKGCYFVVVQSRFNLMPILVLVFCSDQSIIGYIAPFVPSNLNLSSAACRLNGLLTCQGPEY